MARSFRHGKGRDSLASRDARGEANRCRRECGYVRALSRRERRAEEAQALRLLRKAEDPEDVVLPEDKGTGGWETW